MMQAEYSLETHDGGGFHARKPFSGTRQQARAECRFIDMDKKGKRITGQTTHIRFVRYI